MEIAGHRDCGIVYLAACELNLLGIDWIDRLHLSTMPIEIMFINTDKRKANIPAWQPCACQGLSPRHRRWTVGVVLKRIGQVIYNIQVGSLIWKRHVNQLRLTECPTSKAEERLQDLNLLLETFDFPRAAPVATASHGPPKTDPLLKPRRRTGRIRKRVEPLQLDPRRQSYVERPKGEVSGRSDS
ncbi:hypothetical protein CSKR_202833 [Clonorchis sinensis]|uniref:Uncharacterized protein n=1 Tax=Clonorchis sinensis TaxID=79923 RepID=A0A8T1M459_CLOSI|nr:hypothetical protein CSKR_202833 [Clonorchis sinensis]